jgi:hypothetical protein
MKTKKQESVTSIEHLEMEDVVVVKQAMHKIAGGSDFPHPNVNFGIGTKPAACCGFQEKDAVCDQIG